MTSRTSFCDKTLLRKNVTRFAPLWGVYLLCLLIGLGLMYMNADRRIVNFWFAAYMAECIQVMGLVNLFFAPLGMGNSYLSLILVHAVLGVPFVIITVSATLQGFNYNLVRAAASLGASPLTAFFRVTLPLIAPGVISGALFAFATSFDEVVVTLFLAGPEQITLPRQMFSGIRENLSPTIAAAATLLIGFSIALLLTLEWLRGRAEKLRTQQPA